MDEPVDNTTGCATVDIWLPETAGSWWNFATSHVVPTGMSNLSVPISELPLFVKDGSVIPTLPYGTRDVNALQDGTTTVVWAIFSRNATSARGLLYEDDGTGLGYEDNVGLVTKVTASFSSQGCSVDIGAPTGTYPHPLVNRTHVVQVRGTNAVPHGVQWNGQDLEHRPPPDAGWFITNTSDASCPAGTLTITGMAAPLKEPSRVAIVW